MTKLCPRGKAAAKRKFKVYPSAYANAYASKVVDFNKISQQRKKVSQFNKGGIARGCGAIMAKKRKKTKKR